MESTLFLNVVVREGSAILQLFTSKDKPLLIRGDLFLVLNFCFHVLYGIRWLHLQGDGLPGQRLNEDLHASPQP